MSAAHIDISYPLPAIAATCQLCRSGGFGLLHSAEAVRAANGTANARPQAETSSLPYVVLHCVVCSGPVLAGIIPQY